MPEITRDQVEHLARLAHIRMTDEELDTMSGDLEMVVAAPGTGRLTSRRSNSAS